MACSCLFSIKPKQTCLHSVKFAFHIRGLTHISSKKYTFPSAFLHFSVYMYAKIRCFHCNSIFTCMLFSAFLSTKFDFHAAIFEFLGLWNCIDWLWLVLTISLVFWCFWKIIKCKMTDPRWRLFTYDVIISRCLPQRKQFCVLHLCTFHYHW